MIHCVCEKREELITLMKARITRICGEFFTSFNEVFVDFVTNVMRRGN